MESTGKNAAQARGRTAASYDQGDEVDNPRQQQADAEDGDRCWDVYRIQQGLREGYQTRHQADAASYQAKRLLSGGPGA